MPLRTLPATTAALVCTLAASGCDLPTSLPSWTTEWDVLAVDETVAAGDLLPEGVRAGAGGFVIDRFAATSSIRLGDVCELCTCFDGPIPALDIAPHDWPVRLPAGVTQAQLVAGRARVVLTNEIGFDLLAAADGGRGRLEVALVDRLSGAVSERRELTDPFPPGDSLTLEFDLAGLRLHSGLVARVSGRTPGSGGCDVELGEDSGIRARVELLEVVARTVDVVLTDARLALAPRSIDLPAALARRLRPGDARVALVVELESRVPTSAEIELSVAADGATLFAAGAALHTPLVLPAPDAARSADVSRTYLLDLAGVPASSRLHFAARTRITGARVVRLHGGESLRYRIRVRAEVPGR